MANSLTPEKPTIKSPELSTPPKPVEKPKPLGPSEEAMVKTIDVLGDGHTEDPDKSFQAILQSKASAEQPKTTPRDSEQEMPEAFEGLRESFDSISKNIVVLVDRINTGGKVLNKQNRF